MGSRRALGRHSHEIRSHVAGKRLALHFCGRRIMLRRRGACDEWWFSQNATRNLFRQLVAIRDRLRQPSFSRVGEKPAFHKNARNRCLAQNVVTAAPNTAIFRWSASDDILVNVGGERGAIPPIIIGLDSVGSDTTRGIKVDADKNCIAIGVGDRDTRRQRDKYIGVACHDHFITGALQFHLQSQGDIERDIFSGTRWPGIPPRSKPPCPASITTTPARAPCAFCALDVDFVRVRAKPDDATNIQEAIAKRAASRAKARLVIARRPSAEWKVSARSCARLPRPGHRAFRR